MKRAHISGLVLLLVFFTGAVSAQKGYQEPGRFSCTHDLEADEF